MIEFLSIESYKKLDKINSVVVIFFSKEEVFHSFKKKHNIINDLVDHTTIKGKVVYFYHINQSSSFLDISIACKMVSSKILSQKAYIILCHAPEYIESIVYNIFKRAYQFTKYKTNASQDDNTEIFLVDHKHNKPQITDLILQTESVTHSRNMATEPANMLYPSAFCDFTRRLLRPFKFIDIQVMTLQQMRRMGLNLVVGVGISAKHEPRFMVIKADFHARENICLVGKGVVFDSGGYDMKPSYYMADMKGDKTGAAIVVGIINYLAQKQQKDNKKKKYNVIGICPLVENLVSDKAHKTGDVIRSYNGKTVEILNTDAEGRLILADSLAYACDKYKPRYIFDFATLTGWASQLHCDTSYVFYTLNDNLANIVQEVGESVGERSIRMPSWPEYAVFTKSKIADYKNSNYSCSGSDGFMAALFLMNFIEQEYRNRWIHFDITHSADDGLHNCHSIATGINLIKRLLGFV